MMPLKVLMLHSSYRIPGGEDESFRQEAALLRAHGHDVVALDRAASDVSGARGNLTMGCEMLGLAPKPLDLIDDVVRRFQPHVCHVQGYKRWGPASFDLLRKLGVPVVQAVRNWRIAGCPAGTFYRDGAMCTECIGRRFAWPAVQHGCFHGASQSVVAALSLKLHDWTGVHFLAVSEAIKHVMVAAGFEPDRISVKPNTCADPGVGDGSGGFALYVGEPSERRPEKGWSLLAAAWAASGLLRNQLLLVHDRPHSDVLDLMKRAAFVVVPSTWHEPFGRIVIEAYACGTPVLATRMGGLAEIVKPGITGWLVDPDAAVMAEGLKTAFQATTSFGRGLWRARARAEYERLYTPEVNHRYLMMAYAAAMAHKPDVPIDHREALGQGV